MIWKAWALVVTVVLIPTIGCQASAALEAGDETTGINTLQQDQVTLHRGSQEAVGVLQLAMKNPKLQAVMKQHVHPNASIVSLESLNRVSRDKFLNVVDESSPGFVAADFNGDGIPDYAALLTFPQKKSSGEWLVVFMGSKDGSFQLRLLEKYDRFHDDVFITIERSGEVKPLKSARAVKLRTPGIARTHPDRRPTLFYWQKGRFQRLNLSGPQAIVSSLPSSH